MRNYIITFKTGTPYEDCYTYIGATSQEEAFYKAFEIYGGRVSRVLIANNYNEMLLKLKKNKYFDPKGETQWKQE